ncbi:hypothetical protein V2J09_009003 [Rumex salicifolius]
MHWGLTIMQWCNYKIEEVILAAGAIGSPQLLLLSGIGPRPYLSSWGIPLTLHLPYVGQFLYHNPRNGINLLPSMPLEHSAYSAPFGITMGLVGKVVDRDLRVIGINALRVVNGSIFTVSPGTNPQATLMMLGR